MQENKKSMKRTNKMCNEKEKVLKKKEPEWEYLQCPGNILMEVYWLSSDDCVLHNRDYLNNKLYAIERYATRFNQKSIELSCIFN